MWPIKRPQIILSILEAPFPSQSPTVIPNWSVTWDVSVNPKERSQAAQLVRLIDVCMWINCTPLQPMGYPWSTAFRWWFEWKRIHFLPCIRHNWKYFATFSLAHLHLLPCQFRYHLILMKRIFLIDHTAYSPKFLLTSLWSSSKLILEIKWLLQLIYE